MIEVFGTPLKLLGGFERSMPDTAETEYWIVDPDGLWIRVPDPKLLEAVQQAMTLVAVAWSVFSLEKSPIFYRHLLP
jgi:hypothetical protein